MREPQVVCEANRVTRPGPVGGCAPLANAVKGKDGRCFEGAGEECASGVALVVVHEDQRGLGCVGESPADLAAHEQLLLEPQGHGLGEATEAVWGVATVCLQEALELGEWLIVKHHVVELVGGQARLLQTIGNGLRGKSRVIFLACKALLLRGGDDSAVHD